MSITQNRLLQAVITHGTTLPGLDTKHGMTLLLGAYDRLYREGQQLAVDMPLDGEVDRWFVETTLDMLMSSHRTGPHDEALHTMVGAHERWKMGELQISAREMHALRFAIPLASYECSRRRHPYPVTVAFDCDGVLYDFNDTLREWLVLRGWDRTALPEPTVYSLADAWGLKDEHLHEEIALALDAGALWHIGQSLPDGVSAVRYLGEKGHRIIINTARKIKGVEEKCRAATMVWLRENGIHPDALHLADPRDPKDKLAIEFDILLDDHTSNVTAALEAGRDALLIDRPWNRDNATLPRASFSDAIRIIDRQRMPMLVE